MGMTTIQGHLIPGLFIMVLAMIALLHELGVFKQQWIKYLWPVAFVLVGLQGIFDKLMHGDAAPEGYEMEAAQHTIQGSIILAAGIIELLRAKRILVKRAWSLALPVALVAVGVMFLLHAQQGSGDAMLVMLVQHRAYGLTLLLAAVSRALAELAPVRGAGFKVVFPVLLLLFGLQFASYAEAEGGHGAMQMSH